MAESERRYAYGAEARDLARAAGHPTWMNVDCWLVEEGPGNG